MLRFLPKVFWILLMPLSVVWAVVSRVRRNYLTKRAYRSSIPVISIGNIHSGGTGKSPIAQAVYRELRDHKPVVLSRGYRSQKSREGAEVQLDSPNRIALYGDEPCMLARAGLKVYVGKNRVQTIRKFQLESKFGVIILDDGFQHVKLARKLDLVLLPTWKPLSENWCLPLGRLREPLDAIATATALLMMPGEYCAEWISFCKRLAPGVPYFEISEPQTMLTNLDRIPVQKNELIWGAFCGIAEPERFQEWLQPKVFHPYRDHHVFTAEEIQRLVTQGHKSGITGWVTTEKDIQKVIPFWPEDAPPLHLAQTQYTLPTELAEMLQSKVAE